MNNYPVAISLKILHGFIFSVLSVLMVVFSNNIPIVQLIFLRTLIGAFISLIIMLLLKDWPKIFIPPKSLLLYLLRSFIHFAALFCWIYALKELGVNEAIALSYTTPIWKMLLASSLLQEKWSKKNIFIILINSLGVLIILQPKLNDITMLGLAAGFLSKILWSIYDIICKKQTVTEHYITQSFYSHLFSALISLPLALYMWKTVSLHDLLGVSIIAFCGVINIIILFLGYQKAPIIFLIPYEYARLIFASLLSYLLNDIVPTYNLFIGSAIILVVGVYCYKSKHPEENKL
jgi:drug/metabolite transporter (DMT)-like permease